MTLLRPNCSTCTPLLDKQTNKNSRCCHNNQGKHILTFKMATNSFFANLIPSTMVVSIEEDNHHGHCKPSASPFTGCEAPRRPRALASSRWLPCEAEIAAAPSTLPPSPPIRRKTLPTKKASRWSEQSSAVTCKNSSSPVAPQRKSLTPTLPTSPRDDIGGTTITILITPDVSVLRMSNAMAA